MYLRSSIICLSIIIVLTLPGCGGGSEGTGSRSITGRIARSDDTPVVSASIELIQTGDIAITDNDGMFLLLTDFSGPDGTLKVTDQDASTLVPLPNVESDSINLKIDITLEAGNGELNATSVQSWAKIVGACDIYFENNERIRQANKVPKNTQCTVKFFVSGDGERLERISGAIEVRACDSNDWDLVSIGETGIGTGAGVGQISFIYKDDKRHCEYRIGAPFGYDHYEPIYTYIDTFTLQKLKAAS